MSDDTRAMLDEMLLRRLTWRDRWVAIYFALSLAAIIITAEAPIWVMIAMMLNFFNAARIMKTINLPPDEEDKDGGNVNTPAGGAKR